MVSYMLDQVAFLDLTKKQSQNKKIKKVPFRIPEKVTNIGVKMRI